MTPSRPGTMNSKRFVSYPLLRRRRNSLDAIPRRLGAFGPILCPVCGRLSVAVRFAENLRESGVCVWCRATNRNRQLATVLQMSQLNGTRSLPRDSEVHIFNTEARGPIHQRLRHLKNYVASEFLGEGIKSGTVINGVLHQDLMSLSFPDESFHMVISSEVLEHVPDPYSAHAEIYRVLKRQGRHVFTVPFLQNDYLDSNRAFHGESGEIRFLAEPEYHQDPLRPEGALVFTIFGLEMLVRLAKIGFSTRMHHLYSPIRGIFGDNAIVFESIKDREPSGT